MTKKYVVVITIDEQAHSDFQEISKYLLSPKFKGMGIKIMPEDLIPEKYHNTMREYLLAAIRCVHLAKPEDEQVN